MLPSLKCKLPCCFFELSEKPSHGNFFALYERFFFNSRVSITHLLVCNFKLHINDSILMEMYRVQSYSLGGKSQSFHVAVPQVQLQTVPRLIHLITVNSFHFNCSKSKRPSKSLLCSTNTFHSVRCLISKMVSSLISLLEVCINL